MCMVGVAPACATTYTLARNSDLIGQSFTIKIKSEDTLPDIARQYGLGYNEIVSANPRVDPWLPEDGSQVIIPKRFILPGAPRRGIIINLAEMRLYYFHREENGFVDKVMTYPIGIGQEGWMTPTGVTTVTEKIVKPAWTVPDSIIAEREAEEGITLPKVIPHGSPDNPLGDLAMRLAMSRYLIHGTNKPYGVGRRISHGCIRMYPEDIEELFQYIEVGTRVSIINQPYKVGKVNNVLYIEAHEPIVDRDQPLTSNRSQVINSLIAVTDGNKKKLVQDIALTVADEHSGIATEITDIEIDSHHIAERSEKNGKVVQLGAYSNLQNANRLVSILRQEGLPITVQARTTDGYCHVLVGPYQDQQTLEETLDYLKTLTGIEGTILPADRYGLLSRCRS